VSDNSTRVLIKVLPGSSRNEILGSANGVWRFKIAAPPDKGKANKELIEFLASVLGLKRDCISILRGHTSHNKLIAVEGMTLAEIELCFSGRR